MAAPIHSHAFASARVLAGEITKRGHKVVYTGDGADELFLGYKTYLDIYTSKRQGPSDYSRRVNYIDGLSVDRENIKSNILYFDIKKRRTLNAELSRQTDNKDQYPIDVVQDNIYFLVDCDLHHILDFHNNIMISLPGKILHYLYKRLNYLFHNLFVMNLYI